MSTKPELATPLKENQLLAIEGKILFSVDGRRKDEKKRALSQAAYSRTVRGSSKDGWSSSEITQSSLNSCNSWLTSSPDAFKGKKVGDRPRRAFTLQYSLSMICYGLIQGWLISSRPPALRLGALPSDPVLTQSLHSLFIVVFVLGPASFGVVLLPRI
ncbi:hypothetical protein M9H77_23676 [Catharanthus roseus]|uniref:Uncharacterized protein n=1 Tax=Catharanthus roseus TaxID=4058 RepID=A0ACC0AWT2_CATRO|nr:hypothetical protein M9H77_23676 [Catharanthus roseus]